MRKRYDEFGYDATQAPESGFMDPREIFRMLFGGEAFEPIIGEISFAQVFSGMSEENQSQGTSIDSKQWQGERIEAKRRREKLEAELRAKREARVKELAANLFKKLALHSEGNFGKDDLVAYAREEANRLKEESFGPELLQAIGYTYAIRGRQCQIGRASCRERVSSPV